MKVTFEVLCIGDMFNTKSGRWVKISPDSAICVMSSVLKIGTILEFTNYDDNIVIIYSAVIRFD